MKAAALEFIRTELRRLDLLLHREILRLRARYQLSLDEFRGLYVSDAQVDELVRETHGTLSEEGTSDDATLARSLTTRAAALRSESRATFVPAPWQRLVTTFALTPEDEDVLLLALAPEIDLKYETLFAYLNNDIARRWPTIDLALSVVSPTRGERPLFRRHLLPDAASFRSGLLEPLPSVAERPHWLATGYRVPPAVVGFILGEALPIPDGASVVDCDGGAAAHAAGTLGASNTRELQRWAAQPGRLQAGAPLLVLEGRPGAGRESAARMLCAQAQIPLLKLELRTLASLGVERVSRLAREVGLHQRLNGAGLLLTRAELLFDRDGQPVAEASALRALIAAAHGPTFLATAPGTPWAEWAEGLPHRLLTLREPDVAERARLWKRALDHLQLSADDDRLDNPSANGAAGISLPIWDVADRFSLTPGQIHDAALDVATDDAMTPPRALAPLLLAAARRRSTHRLGDLAVRVDTPFDWNDLVLPTSTLQRVREVVAFIGQRRKVYAEWGFGRRVAGGRGLKVLFSGASGTGKTMTAGVIARKLGLDLYRIDLSSVVSKYIGETEKNLARIFRAAATSNAILFFDEADALFGKRSEVKDAHDRYANIEVSYLLQKMEEYEGLVILATNLSRNIDDAFARRLHQVIEFPVPDEALRERLWRGMLPAEVPLADDVDLRFLAKQFPLAGGDIRNVALEAAFLAAGDEQPVGMRHLVRAMGRQLIKQGRIPSPSDLKQYHALLADP